MTPTEFVLIAVAWAVVGLAVAVWRLRRNVIRLERSAILDRPRLHQLWADRKGSRLSELLEAVRVTRAAPNSPHVDDDTDLAVPHVDDHPDAPDTPTTRKESLS